LVGDAMDQKIVLELVEARPGRLLVQGHRLDADLLGIVTEIDALAACRSG
jgi:hypothetical protein